MLLNFNMKESEFIRKAIKVILIALSILIPLVFLPFTLETLELNKHFVLYAFTLLALLLWLLEGASTRKFTIQRTPFDIPILIYIGITLISGIFSKHHFLSFIGDYNNIQLGILPLLFLLIFAFLITQTFTNDRSRFILMACVAWSGFVSAIWFLFDKFNIVPFDFFGVRITNTVSLSNSEFGIYLTLIIIGALSLLSFKKNRIIIDIIAGVFALVSLFILLSLGFKVAYIMLAIGLIIVLAFMLTYVDYLRMSWITVAFGTVVLTVIFIFLNTPRIINFGLPVEISLGVKTSYAISLSTIVENTKQFLIGSGPSTFIYDFSKHKPEQLNLNNFAWKIRFAKPYATFPSMIAETGVLGVVSFLFLVLIVFGFVGSQWIKSLVKKEKITDKLHHSHALVFLVAPVWTTILIAMFFVHLSISLWFLFFLVLALLSTVLSDMNKEKYKEIVISLKSSPQYILATSFAVVLLFAAGIVFGVFAGRFYAAEIAYTDSQISAQNPAMQISALSRASQLNKNCTRYRIALAQAYLNEAKRVSQEADGSPELITRLVSNAVNEARIATEISPKSVSTWETLAIMYENARSFAPGVDIWITKSLEKAVEYEPINPTLHLQLGISKYREGKKTEAKESFEQAIRLKQDYLDAYLQLASYYEAEKDMDRAIIELEKGIPAGRQNDNYLFQIGRLYFNRASEGDWDKSLALFNASLLINPNNVNALFSSGVVFDRRGEREQALKLFEEVLKRDPNNEAVNSRVKQIRSILGVR